MDPSHHALDQHAPALLPPPTSVASRFVSEATLSAAKAQREADWKAAYARLGQEPPEKKDDAEEVYDGRSLWEKLQEHKDKKQEAFEEQIKFKNQFRALDEDEISFLDSLTDDNHEEEERKRKAIAEEVLGFRQAVASRQAPPPPPASLLPVASTSAAATATATGSGPAKAAPPKSKKKDLLQKKLLAGVIVKKAPKPPVGKRSLSSEGPKPDKDDGPEGDAKKRKVEEG